MHSLSKLLHHPIPALVWECWRLSRRWYLWILPVASVMALMLLSRTDILAANRPPGRDEALVLVLIAPAVFMLTFTLAIFATLMAISIGNRSGFPLTFAFRLPVRTSVLVAVPMLALATLCASLYVLPMLVCRILYDLPFPLLAPAAMIGTLVVILLSCSWSANSATSRNFAVIFGMVAAMELMRALDPVQLNSGRIAPGQPPRVGPEFIEQVVTLTAGEYALLAGICMLLFTLATASIRKQRCGEALMWSVPGLAPAKPRTRRFSLSALLERAPDLFALPCPVTSPSRAEIWLELKRQVMPVLLVSALLALCVPLFFLFDFMPGRPELAGADYIFPYIVFFAGVGIAVFNRRQQSAGYMSAFEGTRSMSTLRLASIQILSVAGATLLGIGLVCISIHFSSPLRDAPGNLALRMQELPSAPNDAGFLYMLTATLTGLVKFVSAVVLLACVHTWSVVWGRWIPYGAGAVAIYGAVFAFRIQGGEATFDDIKLHMWGFAVAVFLLTLLAFGRTLQRNILSMRASAIALLCWAVFVACSLYNLQRQDIVLTQQAMELQAFNAALLTTPLLLFVMLLWGYDRLRHR